MDYEAINALPHKEIRSMWKNMALNDGDAYVRMFWACIGRNLVRLAECMPLGYADTLSLLHRHLDDLYHPRCADVLDVLVNRLAIGDWTSIAFYKKILQGPKDHRLVASLRPATLEKLADLIDSESDALCVPIAHYAPAMVAAMQWFEAAPGKVFNGESASRAAVEMGFPDVLCLLVERARAGSCASGVRIAGWMDLMGILGNSSHSRACAAELLEILESVRPNHAYITFDELDVGSPGVFEALHAYICWPALIEPQPHQVLWLAVQVARRKQRRVLPIRAPSRLTPFPMDPTCDAHQPGLCLAAWAPTLHAQTGWTARHSTAAILAAARPSAAAALRLGRAVVDAHRLFALPEAQ